MENASSNYQPIWTASENLDKVTRPSYGTHEAFETTIVKENLELLEEIKKQELATAQFNKLLSLEDNNTNIIGFLWAFLEQHTNFLAPEQRLQLIEKMKLLEKSDCIDQDNSIYIKHLYTNLLVNTKENNEAFETTLESFYNYNEEIIRNMVTSQTEVKGHSL